MIDDDGNVWLTAARLIDLLSRLPANSRVSVNLVGDLVAKMDDGGEIAEVDLSDGSLWWYDGQVKMEDGR